MFDAGALVFKLQTIGAQIFKQDQADAKSAVEKTGQAAQDAKPKIDELGKSTDETGKKAKSAKAPLDEQAKATEDVGEQSRKAKPKQDEQKRSTEQQAEAAKKLSAAMLIAGTAIGALVGLAIAKNTEFDAAMSNVRAATMSTAAEQKKLGEAALKAGGDTKYSASEAAAAEEELAKAGLTVSEVVGGSLNGALALAAAGQLQVARSAEIMATTLTQFGLTADQSGHVADVLAAGAGKAQGSVDDLALALTYVGPLAKSAGWGIDETGGALAYFASQGILGEKAGTSLRGVLAALQSPSTIAKKTMDDYGLSVYDANGKMLSASQMAGQMQKAFAGLTDEERNAAMGRIFGNESLTAATLLYQGGAEKIQEWTAAVDDSGYAAQQAAMRQDNLAGDVEKLGGAFDTALIKSGSAANDVLRTMVQGVTALVDGFGEAPEPVQSTALILGVATAAILLFGGGAVGARVKFLELKAQLDATNVSMGRTAVVGVAAGLALSGIIAVVAMVAQEQAAAQQRAESYADTLAEGTQKITDATRDLIAENMTLKKGGFLWSEGYSMADNANKLGISLETVRKAIEGNAGALTELDQKTQAAMDGYNFWNTSTYEASSAAQDLRNQVEGETGALDQAAQKARDKAKATDEGTDASKSAADAYLSEAKSVDDLERKLSDLLDTINEANGKNQDAISANADYQKSLADIADEVQRQRDEYERTNDTLDGFSLSLDENTESGSANAAMLSDVAEKAQTAAERQFNVDLATMSAKDASDKYYSTLQNQRAAFEASASAAGFNAEQVKALGDRVFNLPPKKDIEIVASTAAAQNMIDRFVTLNNGRRVTVFVDAEGGQSYRVGTTTVSPGYADGAVVRFNAAGNVYRSENHVAQIARAGDWRVWAEPETGGETYVPHAMSKRGRAEAIMQETASIFGGVYIPAGATAFASGGSTQASVGAGLSSPGGLELMAGPWMEQLARLIGREVATIERIRTRQM